MVEIKLSERAFPTLKLRETSQNILAWIGEAREMAIRQQTLAEKFGCSRRTIGRALKELKEGGFLIDLNKRHENRCKLYLLTPRLQQASQPDLSPVASAQGEQQLKLYRPTFEAVFRDWPDWERYYPQVTRQFAGETNTDILWRQTFDGLYVIRDGPSTA